MIPTDAKAGALLLAIDDAALPLRENVCLYLSKPTVRAEPVLTPEPRESSAPDNCAAMFYGTVLEDPGPFGGRFRMWYHACHRGMNPDWPADIARQFAKYRDPVLLGPACYAESDDGIAWRKPSLGQVRFKGGTDNNAIDLPHGLTGGVNVLRDDGDPDPARRYKMVYEIFPRHSDPPIEGAGRMSTVVTAVSPDGLRWRVTGIPYVDHFIEQSGFYKHGGRYIIGYQAGDAWGSHFSEGGRATGRCGLVRYSHDFDHWVEGCVESLVLPEPDAADARGSKGAYDQNHLGTAAVSCGNVCVGLYGLWHNRPDFADISCDLGLAVSNDGLVFREPAKGHAFLRAEDSPAAPHPDRAFHTNLCQASGILNVGDETRLYHGRWRNTGFEHLDKYYGETALAVLPRDRWGALGLFPNREEGSVWSAPFAAPAGPPAVTMNIEGGGGMTVEVFDERFKPIPACSGADAGVPVLAAGLDVPVQWSGGPVALPRGKPVRLRIGLRRSGGCDPRLYAVRVDGKLIGGDRR